MESIGTSGGSSPSVEARPVGHPAPREVPLRTRTLTILVILALVLGGAGLGVGVYSTLRVVAPGTPADTVLFDATVSAIRGDGSRGYYGFDNFTIPGSNELADIGIVVSFSPGGCGNPPVEECMFEFVQSTSNAQSIVLDGVFLIDANTTLNSAYHGNTVLPPGSPIS